MKACPRPEILVAAAEDRLDARLVAAWRVHFETCPECTRALAGLRSVGTLLSELARAERQAASPPVWAQVAARLEQPRVLDRLPVGLAGALRPTRAFLQPAVAGGVAATLGGLALGTWLAIAFHRAAATSLAVEPYAASSLVDDGAGLADTYFALGADSPGASETATPGSSAADSEGATP